MEDLGKNILKTVHYADLFDYPLKREEIHYYLISQREVSLEIVVVELNLLVKEGRLLRDGGYYFLPGRQVLIETRQEREAFSRLKMARIREAVELLRLWPWTQMIGLTGALAVGNADEQADADLMVITSPGRLWLTRLFVFVFLKIIGLKRDDRHKEASGKICINLWLDEENLAVGVGDRDLVVGHEIVQMKPLVNKNRVYEKFVAQNLWLKQFLPNWNPSPEGFK